MRNTLKTKKDLIRKEILKKRDSLPTEERLEKSIEIVSRLLILSEIIKAKRVFTYVSFRSEVMTHRMIKLFMDQNKVVCVPLTDLKKKFIIPSIITSFENDLVLGCLNILEPAADKINPMPVDEIDIIIVPGAAFSENGCRIGYGGGFYDRFLKKSHIKTYALAFDFQLVDDVPFDPEFDMKVDYIVTEKRLVKCS